MAKKSKNIEKIRSDLYGMICIHLFLERDQKIGDDLKKGMKEGRPSEPYYYFDQRLLGYCYLLQQGLVNYLDIIKYERDHCDDGGNYLRWCMSEYGTSLHQSIICAFEPQNHCYFKDEKDKNGLENSLNFIITHLHKKMCEVNHILNE